MGRFSKHLGEGAKIKIDDEEFIIKPLLTDHAPLFLELMSMGGDSGFDLSKINKTSANTFKEILEVTLERSFPEEWKNDQEELKMFGMKYMTDIMGAIIDVNMPPRKEGRESKVEELKSRLKPND